MTGEIGQLALCLALALALVQAAAGIVGRACTAPIARARRVECGARHVRVRRAGVRRADLRASSRRISASLDVAQNSHTLKPLIYKITGVWGNHEGSMLLWVLVLAIYSRGHRARAARRRAADIGGARRAGTARGRRSCSSSSSRPIRSCASIRRRSKAQDSIRCCRIPVSRSIRRCSTSAMSDFRRRSPMPPRRSSPAKPMRAWARAARPFMLVAWIALTLGITLRQLVGLLRARLGRVLVLGSGGERGADAVAGRRRRLLHSRARDRAHRRVPQLDVAARHRRRFR